jgi:hypothetical protein
LVEEAVAPVAEAVQVRRGRPVVVEAAAAIPELQTHRYLDLSVIQLELQVALELERVRAAAAWEAAAVQHRLQVLQPMVV